MKISVLGCGRWASFLAWYLHKTEHDVLIWGRPGSRTLQNLMETRQNQYLTLAPEIALTDDLSRALEYGDLVLISISAQNLRSFLHTFPFVPKVPLVLCMKGLEEDTGLRLSQVVSETLGAVPVAVWAGPGHPQDFVRDIPNCMLIDSADHDLTRRIADSLGSRLIRFYYGQDIIGTEIGAAAKNVIGLAAGMLDGLGRSCLKGVLMARGAREISRLAKNMGGQEITIYGLCHLGDYEATLFSPYSHNRRYGECFVRGEDYGQLAEGVATVRSLCRISRDRGVELPICHAVESILAGTFKGEEALENLFLRSIKPEF